MHRRLIIAAVLMLVLIEGAFRAAGAHRFQYWLDYGYSDSQGLLDRGDGKLRLYSSAHRRFWPRELAVQPAAGVHRIVVVGDSVARGSAPDNHFPHFAERALRAAGCNAEVINLSSGGYGSARKAVVTDMALRRLKPQVLVYQMSVTTEFEDTVDERRRAEAQASPWQIERVSYAALWLKERKTDILHERRLSQRIREHGQESGQALASKRDVQAWLPRMWTHSQMIGQFTRQAGVALVVMPRVVIDRATGQVDDLGLGTWAARLAGDQGVFDWSAGLSGLPTAQMQSFFADTTHLTRAGNELVGHRLAQWLMSAGLCPTAPR